MWLLRLTGWLLRRGQSPLRLVFAGCRQRREQVRVARGALDGRQQGVDVADDALRPLGVVCVSDVRDYAFPVTLLPLLQLVRRPERRVAAPSIRDGLEA